MDILKTKNFHFIWIGLLTLFLSGCFDDEKNGCVSEITEFDLKLVSEDDLCACYANEAGQLSLDKLFVCLGNIHTLFFPDNFSIDSLKDKYVLLWTSDSLFLISSTSKHDASLSQILASSISIDLQECLFKEGHVREYSFFIRYESKKHISRTTEKRFKFEIKNIIDSYIDKYHKQVGDGPLWPKGTPKKKTSVLKMIKADHKNWFSYPPILKHDPIVILEMTTKIENYLDTVSFVKEYGVKEISIPVSFYEIEQLTSKYPLNDE